MNTYSESVELHRSYETAATPEKPEGANLSELFFVSNNKRMLITSQSIVRLAFLYDIVAIDMVYFRRHTY
jgi:hypothetical protein